MKTSAIEEQIGKARALDSWFTSVQGSTLDHAFSAELHRYPDLFTANTILQLGMCGHNSWLNDFKNKEIYLATPDKYNHQANMVCSYQNIPLDRKSVDLVIAPFTVELFNNQLAFLDEIDRVLKPMGQVVIWGINTFSLWSLAARFGQFSCFPGFKVRAHSPFFVSRSFIHKGYMQKALESFWYIPPSNNQKLMHKLDFLNQMGKMVAPFPAGFYYYIAQKFEPGYPPVLVENRINTVPAMLQPLGG